VAEGILMEKHAYQEGGREEREQESA